VVVADNGSTDRTALRAHAAGAFVVWEPRRGYGQACLSALWSLRDSPPDVVAFMDGDGADEPGDLARILDHLEAGSLDLVVGSRSRSRAEPGALLPQAVFGNWLSTRLIERLYGVRFTDLGPLRAIRWEALTHLRMQDLNFGWTVEMQARAARLQMRCGEIPVRYRRRVGQSKVSGTVRGSVLAGRKILWTLARERWRYG
jgi:glycosyltransferase involved in cell wall biosynthesis